MTTAEILNAAADLIEPEGAWIQRDLATSADGRHVSPTSPLAACFCAAGAIWRAGSGTRGGYFDGLQAFEDAHDGAHPMTFNDAPERTQAEVVAALRDAAKAAEPETAA